MRWIREKEPEVGAKRLVSRFLIWPTTLPDCYYEKRVTRWLERARIWQRVKMKPAWMFASEVFRLRWEDMGWDD
jgi:hypothetical protein